MKASFNLRDSKRFKSSFNLDSEFIEVLLTRDFIYFVNVRNGFYSHVEYPIISREDFSDIVAFRMPRGLFLSILEDATITVEIMGDNYVTLYFTKDSDDSSYTITVEHEVPNMQDILDNIAIIEAGEGKNPLNLSELGKYKQLFNTFGGIISVGEDGRVRLFRDDWGTIVYVNVKADRVSIPAMFLGFLLDNTDSYYGYRNVIIGSSENNKVIVHQSFSDDYSDFEYVTRIRYSAEFEVDFSPIYKLSKKVSKEIKGVGLNLTTGKAFTGNSRARVASPFPSVERRKKDEPVDLTSIDFSSLEDVEVVEDISIELNTKAFNEIFPKAGSKFVVRVGDRNIIMSNKKGVTFVLKRVNISSGLHS